ncbi:MAG: metal ABC transporter ATP-binding protein [Gemmatimonadota bacterium]
MRAGGDPVLPPASGEASGAAVPAIELRDVWFSYRDVLVLEDVDLALEEGDFLGIIGPNGGGKTTLLKLILGLLEPDRGKIRIFGRRPADGRGEIGYVPQYARFDSDFPISVLDTVLMGRLGWRRAPRFFGTADRETALRALDRVLMADLADRQIGRLSGGQLQRVLIARALAVEPRILLLDEPTASVDTQVGRSVYELLDELAREITVVLVSHDIGVISRHVKTIACLNRRFYYHHSRELTAEMLEAAYGCPVELVAHGHPHRVLGDHGVE